MNYTRLQKTAARIHDKGFKIKNRLLYPFETKKGDGKLILLARNGVDRIFDNLGEISEYGVGFDHFRNKPTFEVSSLEQRFGRIVEGEVVLDQYFNIAIQIATHIAITPQNDIYWIKDGDEEPIIFTDFTVKIFASKIGDKYVIEEEEEEEEEEV